MPIQHLRQILKKTSNSTHYEFIELAQGVLVAVARPEGLAFGNAAIIDLGDETLVLDAGECLAAGAELRAAAEDEFRRPVATLVLSHHHGDHWKGTAAFGPETRVLASRVTSRTMEAAAIELERLKSDPSGLEAELGARKARLRREQDPRWRAGLERSIRRREDELANLAEFVVRLPDEVFNKEMVFEGTKRRALLKQIGPAHSRDDSILALPEDGILFLADLGFFGEQPVMRDCDPAAWRALMETILAGEYETLVPGHGQPGGKAELAKMGDYLVELQARVQAALETGGEAAARGVEPGENYQPWLMGGMGRLDENIESLIQALRKQGSDTR